MKNPTASVLMSVCVPVYNAELRIEQTLFAIDAAIASLPKHVAAEIIVVDNGSSDRTREIVQGFADRQECSYACRIVLEAEQGVAFARRAGWAAAAGDIVVFCDDDVSPGVDSLKIVLENAESSKRLGGGGGVIVAALADDCVWPPWLTEPLRINLALTGSNMTEVLHNPPHPYWPVSAFVWFRREALAEWASRLSKGRQFVLGPAGTEMWRGDDQEMDIITKNAGWALKFDPTIRVEHRIPKWRVTPTYMTSLLYWNGRSYMRLENRWGSGSWYFCFSRALYRMLFRQPKKLGALLMSRNRPLADRLRLPDNANNDDITNAMHFAFQAGVFDEMVSKSLSPWRF